MKILLTGATGFVGSWLAKKLINEGHSVHILRRQSSDTSQLQSLSLVHEFGDVTDIDSLNSSFKKVDCVFHLAGCIGYSTAMRSNMEKVNIEGTKNVISSCIKNDIKKLVYMSSVVAIGSSFDGKQPLNESSPYNVAHLNLGYFETKHKAEELVIKASRDGQVDSVILNPTTIYGPGDAKKGSRKVQVKVAQGRMPFYTSGGVNVVHVEDVIEATYNAFQHGKCGERYILGSENITIQTLFKLIAEAADVSAPKIYLPNCVVHSLGRFGDLMEKFDKKFILNSETAWTSTLFHWFDSTKAQREIGLKIRPAKESIFSSVKWMKENHIL